jgi:hypothetical protein
MTDGCAKTCRHTIIDLQLSVHGRPPGGLVCCGDPSVEDRAVAPVRIAGKSNYQNVGDRAGHHASKLLTALMGNRARYPYPLPTRWRAVMFLVSTMSNV